MPQALISANNIANANGKMSTIGYASVSGFPRYGSGVTGYITLKYKPLFIFYKFWHDVGIYGIDRPVFANGNTGVNGVTFDGLTLRFPVNNVGSGAMLMAVFSQPVDVSNIIANYGNA